MLPKKLQQVLDDRPLENDLQALGYPSQNDPVSFAGPIETTSPFLQPQGQKATKLTDGAAKFNVLQVPYDAGAGAGNFSNTAKLTLDGLPLGFVWYLGAIDSTGVVKDTGAGLLNRGKTYASLNTEIYGAVAGCSWTSSSLSVVVKSSNIGAANLIIGYFYYSFYYDDLQVKKKGL